MEQFEKYRKTFLDHPDQDHNCVLPVSLTTYKNIEQVATHLKKQEKEKQNG